METYDDHSHLNMLPPGWLHVNGVSLSTDSPQQVSHTSDDRTKNTTSPVPPSTPPLISSTNSIPLSMTAINAQNPLEQYKKLENVDLPKKLFIDRQIKKAKSLPGIIK